MRLLGAAARKKPLYSSGAASLPLALYDEVELHAGMCKSQLLFSPLRLYIISSLKAYTHGARAILLSPFIYTLRQERDSA